MGDLNYYRTFITVAADCPVDHAVVPTPRAGRTTVAVLQYEMLAGHPYEHTQPDVLFNSWFARQDGADRADAEQRARIREEFFGRSQACLRASPLPKQYGWGLRFDADGRVALCAMESGEYQHLANGSHPDLTVLPAMRSRRR